MKEIEIYTDGSCLSNPGGKGGYAVLLCDGTNITKLSAGYKATTNNRMELMSFLAALQEVSLNYSENEVSLVFNSDSKYSIGVLDGSMKSRKNLDLISEIRKELNKYKHKFIWVEGHQGIQGNETCDELARAAANSDYLFEDVGYYEQ